MDRVNSSTETYQREVAAEKEEFAKFTGPRVIVLDPTPYLTQNGVCPTTSGGNPLYRDDHHLTTHGAMLLRPMFEPLFAQ